MTFGSTPLDTSLSDDEGKDIEQVSCMKDSGVVLQDNGKFDEHIQLKVGKAFQMCGWIYRTFNSRDSMTMLTLHKPIIQPHLEYASPIWAPLSSAGLQKVEQVQRCFTRNFTGLRELKKGN
jgi:hypothetical protein